jgi:DNA repair exonuclease SbcCD ATPase subunit
MCWNTWSTNAAKKKRLQVIMLRIVEKWTNKGLTQAWSTWELKWREEKRLRNAMRKVFGRWTRTSLSKTWETWSGHAKEQGRMIKVAGRIVVRMENLMLWTVWNTWASNAAELKRTNAIASKVVARWRNQTMGEVFNRWKGKSEEEKRARQVGMKIVQRWTRGCRRKAFMRWIFYVDEQCIQEQAKSAGLEINKEMSSLQDVLNDKIRELEKKLASSEKAKAESLCQLDAKKAECDEGNDTISNLLREIKAKAGELSACQAELQKKTKALEGLQAELDRLSKLSAADASRLQHDLQKALSDHEKLKKVLDLAEGELRNSKKDNADLKSHLNKMEEEAARLCKELDGKSCQLYGMSRQLSEAEELQLEQLSELRDAEAAVRSVEENLRELNKEMKVSRRSGLKAARNPFLEERLLAAELLMSPDTQRAKYGTLIQAFQEHLEIIHIFRDELKSFKNSLVQYISKKKAASGFRKALYSWHYYVQEEIRLERAGQIIVKRRNNQVSSFLCRFLCRTQPFHFILPAFYVFEFLRVCLCM